MVRDKVLLTLCGRKTPGGGGGAGNLLSIAHLHALIIRLIVDHVHLAQRDKVPADKSHKPDQFHFIVSASTSRLE